MVGDPHGADAVLDTDPFVILGVALDCHAILPSLTWVLALARIAVWHEGKRRNDGAQCLAAHQQVDRCCRRRAPGGQITHGNRAVDAGTKAARGNAPEPFTQRREDLGTGARRCPPIGLDADAAAFRAVGQLVLNPLRTGKTALAAPAL